MKSATVTKIPFAPGLPLSGGISVGQIVGIDDDGIFFVDFPDNDSGNPVAARITNSVRIAHGRGEPVGQEVLLAFPQNDRRFPIIFDTLHVRAEAAAGATPVAFDSDEPRDVTIDGRRISFKAEEEIVLTCGKASITLTGSGKIVIKGAHLLSQSLGENRLKGASVSIN